MTTLRLLAAVALVALALALAPAVAAENAGRPFDLVLTGAAERPGPGHPTGTGTAHLQLNPGHNEVCYSFTTSGIVDADTPIVGAHIHRAPSTAAGPVVIPTPATTSTGGAGCVSAARGLIVDIIRNPDNYYFNVHTSDFLAGALRAQLG